MKPHPEPLFTQRLLLRATLLNRPPEERAYWSKIFDHAQLLGQLLHAARQQLDTWQFQAPVSEELVRLWEAGLVLPEEIDTGELTRLARWYIDRLREQRDLSPLSRMQHDSIALVTELTHNTEALTLGQDLFPE